MYQVVVAFVLSLMVVLAPPNRRQYEPAAQETPAQAQARYEAVANSIVRVAFDPEVKPLFGGSQGRMKTALMVTLIFFWESGFRKDVDLGLERTRLARTGWNDFGRSWCMGQINLGRKPMPDPENPGSQIEESSTTTPQGWTGRDLVADRDKCVRETIRVARQSFAACRRLPMEERYAMYAAGTCGSEKGKEISRYRMRGFWARLGGLPKLQDEAVLQELDPTVEDMPAIARNP